MDQDFVVSLYTMGNSCVSLWDTHVFLEPTAALIVPVDRYQLVGGWLDIGIFFPHQATVRFTRPGASTVTLRGRDLRTDGLFEWVDTVCVQ